MLSRCVLDFSVGVWAFVIGPSQISSFLYCYERDFMSNLHKSKRYDLIVICNVTLDISTIYSPSITLNLRNIFDSSIIMPFSWCVVAVTLPIKCRSTSSVKPPYIHFRCIAGIHGGCGLPSRRRRLLPGTWSHLEFAGVRECPP